ncbi:MAG: PrsW family intramembrane metalloprotease [Clostridia bacterium]|nr:PrsW family intramembrane metalloprotease [Clostridia bacterium]
MSIRVLLAVSCLPSIALLFYVYKKDRVEKEPIGLLLLLFGLGAVSCIPAALLESFFTNLSAPILGENTLGYQLYENFLNVALFEELCKFLMLFIVTHKNKNFNSLFDGIVYSVFVALGFATLENIMYVYQFGLSTGLVRAITAIPGHMFDGVIMGQFYALWHLSKNISITEKAYAKAGFIDVIVAPERKYKLYLPLAIFIPMLTHGMYDFLASMGTVLSLLVFIVFLVGLYIYCFCKIRKISKTDQYETNLIAAALGKKYPYLYGRIQQAMAYNNQMQYNPFTQAQYSPYSSQNNFGVQYGQYPQAQVQQPYGQQQVPYAQQQPQQPVQQPGQQPYSPYAPSSQQSNAPTYRPPKS